jgi:signal peptidase II
MPRLTKIPLILLTLTLSVGCDQTAKSIARSQLSRTAVVSLAGDTLRLQYAENKGAFLSLGSTLPPAWRKVIFVVGTAGLVGLLLVYLLFGNTTRRRTLVALSLIGGGGLSNLIDRVLHDGAVVDFLNLGVAGLRTGIFNPADVALTLGVLLLLYDGMRPARLSVEP